MAGDKRYGTLQLQMQAKQCITVLKGVENLKLMCVYYEGCMKSSGKNKISTEMMRHNTVAQRSKVQTQLPPPSYAYVTYHDDILQRCGRG